MVQLVTQTLVLLTSPTVVLIHSAPPLISKTLSWVGAFCAWALAQALGAQERTRGPLRLTGQKDNSLDWNDRASFVVWSMGDRKSVPDEGTFERNLKRGRINWVKKKKYVPGRGASERNETTAEFK